MRRPALSCHVQGSRPGMALWREKLFVFMLGNAAQAPDLFRIPSDQVVELHMTIEIRSLGDKQSVFMNSRRE